MTPFVFLLFFLLGVGRNLPFEGLYFHGLGAADLFFVLACLRISFSTKWRTALQGEVRNLRTPILAMAMLSVFALTSLALNGFIYGVSGKDIFEILKYLYLLTIMVVTSLYVRYTGPAPAFGFVVGVIFSGVVALLNPMNPDVLGTPQIFNPNVIGNVLAVSIVFCSVAILMGYPITGGTLAAIAAIISFFTFSKGTWLMTVVAAFACFLALLSQYARQVGTKRRYEKYFGFFLFGTLLAVAFQYSEVIFTILQAKIAATEFGATAAEGGSFSARAGLILSAIHMFTTNPLLGVGISNFEYVNTLQQHELGPAYYDDDNPNSAWFYVLACMGLPALLLFSLVFYWLLSHVNRIPTIRPGLRVAYTGCVGMVLFIGGNVQIEMLSAYYYWVVIGIIAALTTPANAVSPTYLTQDTSKVA